MLDLLYVTCNNFLVTEFRGAGQAGSLLRCPGGAQAPGRPELSSGAAAVILAVRHQREAGY